MEMSNTNAGYPPSSSVNNPAVTSSIDVKDPNIAPAKRRPGRPKGSTNKKRDGEPEPVKVKRPVGRPRKDGFPAGSVSAPRPAKQPRLSSGGAPQWSTGFAGAAFPNPAPPPFATVAPANGLPVAAVVTTQALIDPSLQTDVANQTEWGHLYRTDQNAFLSSLISALAAPNPVSITGPSIEEAYKSHLVSLGQPPSNTSSVSSSQMTPQNATPSLYHVLKTFWLPSSPSYFSLTASASTARTPSEHRFLYWDPLPLVFNGIACPSCAQPLINKGRISSGPIKIYDMEKPFFIIGCEYVCNSPQCISSAATSTSSTAGSGRRFSSTDSSIFRSLPQRLKDEFPAKLIHESQDAGPGPNIWNWQPLGVSRPLWNLVKMCLRLGMGKEVIISLIMGVQQGGSVVGTGGIMGAPIVLAAGPVTEEKVEHQGYQQHSQGQGHVTVEIEEDGLHPGDEEDQLQDDQDGHDGQQGPPNGAGPAPEFFQRFLEVYSHAASTPNTQPPSSHTVSVTNTPTMQPMPSPHIAAQPQALPQPHQQGPQPQGQPQQVIPVAVQLPTVQVQSPGDQQHSSPFQQHQQPPGPATQVYDYAKPYPPYQYAAYAFFPHTNSAVAGGSPNLQAAGLAGPLADGSQQQQHNPLKRAYPFVDPATGRPGPTTTVPSTLTAEPHLLTSPQSSHPATPSPSLRHKPHPHAPGQAVLQPSQIATSSSGASASGSTVTPVTGAKARNPRHCSKCGKADCKGKGGRTFCTNGCQDCGKLECSGRTGSRKPEKRCDNWIPTSV